MSRYPPPKPGSNYTDEIVFACRQEGRDGHWYASFGYYANNEDRKAYGAQGHLMVLNVRTGKTRILLEDVKGTVRDPQVSYNGQTILFSYRPGGTDQFHLYEFNRDGSGLKQLTHGIYDDFEPTYLPDGGIAFVSSRGKRWVNCWLTQVAILYRCDSDGSNIQPLSCNGEQDNTPWALCHAGKLCLGKIKRFDMPGFQPPKAYVREMQRYGVLPKEPDQGPVNSYRLDQAYWQSLWHQPSKKTQH